jgi:hypothetical protein
MPVTIPVDDPIVATPVLLLLQIPPMEASDSVVVKPVHTVVEPVIVAGAALTVTILVSKQLPSEYEITAVPTATPVTTPDEFIVATAVFALLHAPPPVAPVKVVVAVGQILVVPEIETLLQ